MLKAALAGKGGSVPPQEGKLDASSFPCIDEGKPMADDVAATFADLKLSTSTLAGSMPIRMGSYKGSVRRQCGWGRPPALALGRRYPAAVPPYLPAAAQPAALTGPAIVHCIRRWIMSLPPAACGQPKRSSQPRWCAAAG